MRCFSSPGSPPVSLQDTPIARVGCPIRTSADQFVICTPRSLSQLITSFFASESQGILRTPFFNFLACVSLRLLDSILLLNPSLFLRISLLTRLLLKLFFCFFQHVKELYFPFTGLRQISKESNLHLSATRQILLFQVNRYYEVIGVRIIR